MKEFNINCGVYYQNLDNQFVFEDAGSMYNSLTTVCNAINEDAHLFDNKVYVGFFIKIKATTQLEAYKKAYAIIQEHYMPVTKWLVDDFVLGERYIAVKFLALDINIDMEEVIDEVEQFVVAINDKYYEPSVYA